MRIVSGHGNKSSSSGDEAADPATGRRYGVATTPKREPALAVDVAFGVVVQVRDTASAVGRPLRLLAKPVANVVLRPPLVPRRLQPATWLDRAAHRGAVYRGEVVHDLDAVLDRLLPALLVEMMRHLEITELVLENVDVATLAREVIAEIDLPEIIRDSTGAVASDTLLGVRMQSISGDEAIARAMDRLRLRLARRTAGPGSPELSLTAEETVIVASPKPDAAARMP